ncbi:hypothetical protein HW452_15400 [Halomonas aquamarina]|uniref:Uncharacterized protein n=1 Tax=Vreelandella aquamarina TaxID=77097 RepID=A0ACC5VYF5_9GAMM|nr:hypothetical protein [Halomonas aquamarina]MBZ5488909.1 hypothetical protein [Halomonas aquamarina]
MLIAGCMALAGCAGHQPERTPSASTAEPAAAPASVATPAGYPTTGTATDWVPPLYTSPEEEAYYYVSRLADRRFVSTYGDRANPRIWYLAAERLGEIGMPAVPLLFARLDTQDDYELMLALYALQLATQDPLLMARTGGNYVQLPSVLNASNNADNVQVARQWWQQYAGYLD